MRGSKWSHAHDAAWRKAHASCRMNHRCLHCLLRIERRQQTRKALSEHGFARPWRADDEQVMTTGSGNLEREPTEGLPANICQIGWRGNITCYIVVGHRRPRAIDIERIDDFAKRGANADTLR